MSVCRICLPLDVRNNSPAVRVPMNSLSIAASDVGKPETLLAWYRKLIANKFDGSKFRKSWGRPRVDEETERLVVRMAKENPG